MMVTELSRINPACKNLPVVILLFLLCAANGDSKEALRNKQKADFTRIREALRGDSPPIIPVKAALLSSNLEKLGLRTERVIDVNIDSGKDVKHKPSIWNLRWSPDSSIFAFEGGDNWAGTWSSIYIIRSDGTKLKRLTEEGFRDQYPRWSCDGKRIVFKRKVYSEENSQIHDMVFFSINVDGTGLTRVTEGRFRGAGHWGFRWETPYSWFPDVKFKIDRGDASFDLSPYVAKYDGTEKVKLFDCQYHIGLVWSLDSTRLLITDSTSSTSQLRTVRRDGGCMRTILETGYSRSSYSKNSVACRDRVASATWSPDSSKIAFLSERATLYIINADGTGLTMSMESELPVYQFGCLDWSPDGSHIAYVANKNKIVVLSLYTLYSK